MKEARIFLILAIFSLLIAGNFCAKADELCEDTPAVGSDLLLSEDGKTLFVLEEGTCRLRVTATDGLSPPAFVPLSFRPCRMAFFPGGEKIAAVGGEAYGRLVIVNLRGDQGEIAPILEREIPVGHTPSDVAVGLSPEGKARVYVSNRFNGTIWEIDAETGAKLREFDVGREPFSLEISPDFKRLVTAGLLTERRADVAFTMAAVRVVELESGEVFTIEMGNGVTNLKDIAVASDGIYAFVTGTIGNYQTVTSQVVGGWIVENVVSVVDIVQHERVDLFYLDDTLRGAANPWGIAIFPDQSLLAVALSGTDEIMLLPYDRVCDMLKNRPSGNRPGYGTYIYNAGNVDESRLPFRTRVMLSGPGIRRIVAQGNCVWAVSRFRDTVEKIEINLHPPYKAPEKIRYSYPKAPKPLNLTTGETQTAAPAPVTADSPLRWNELEPFEPFGGMTIRRFSAPLGPIPAVTPVRRGEELFHSALYCMEHWQSCITCHPDGRVDGLNWDLLNDGVGNPKNTKSLLLSHETPPAMITGVRKDAETAVRAGVEHILFGRLSEDDCCAMDAYLEGLEPVVSPHLVNGKLSESAERGRFLFESKRTGCSDCHPAPLFTDLALHKTESTSYNESRSRFDTPTLIEVWRTAPYMNNGHWLTVRETLIEGGHGNRDGKLDALSNGELDDLIEYVLSL